MSIISNSYNYILIQYYHLILDGESIKLLIEIIAKLLLKRKVNYNKYNAFSDGVKLLEKKIPKNKELKELEEYNFKRFFSTTSNTFGEVKKLPFKLEIKPILLFGSKHNINISVFIQYCLSKALLTVTKDDINYGLVNSNRAMLDNDTRLLLGNIINVLNHFYKKMILKISRILRKNI
ncbi:MAG: hypothetical protein GX981_04700 [Tissierellia bacterium]|nr:hypothetical protein [Tissierellia bacterium]